MIKAIAVISSLRPRGLQAARAALIIGLLIPLGACDNSASEDARPALTPEQEEAQLNKQTKTASGFAKPTKNGSFGPTDAAFLTRKFTDSSGAGYSYQIRRVGPKFIGLAGILPETDLGPLPKTGLAAMSGGYEVTEVGKSDGQARGHGEPEISAGPIRLIADFEFGTLTGSGGDLSIDASFKSSTLTGQAFFNDRPAALTGKIGEKKAVGVFHDANETTALVGGFYVGR